MLLCYYLHPHWSERQYSRRWYKTSWAEYNGVSAGQENDTTLVSAIAIQGPSPLTIKMQPFNGLFVNGFVGMSLEIFDIPVIPINKMVVPKLLIWYSDLPKNQTCETSICDLITFIDPHGYLNKRHFIKKVRFLDTYVHFIINKPMVRT